MRLGERSGDAVHGPREAAGQARSAGPDVDPELARGDPLGGPDEGQDAEMVVHGHDPDRGHHREPDLAELGERGRRRRAEPGVEEGRQENGDEEQPADGEQPQSRDQADHFPSLVAGAVGLSAPKVPRGRAEGPARALYSAGPTRGRRARREGERRSLEATRPPRETDGLRPVRSPGSRRGEGAVYPGPEPPGRGLFVCPAQPRVARARPPGPSRGVLMPATVIVGLQWGDEGKGKTTDFLAEQVAVAVRYQGGDNAGHTIVLGDEVFKLHLVPSGVLYPHITCLIGPGVVVNPAALIGELDALTARGVDVSKVRVSRASHVIMPYHPALDRASEARLGADAVGTTHRGIGPAYADRAARVGLRMEDLLDPEVMRRKLERILPEKNLLLGAGRAAASPSRSIRSSRRPSAGVAASGPHLADTTALVQDALRRGEHVLLEGAQGTLLDLDHGSYPFVTSSNPIAGGACTGGGIGPLQVDEVIGVMKAYSTRVGSGPFPTELLDAVGEDIATRGREVGTTTGRRRRVGWFDAVSLRYAVAVNSVSAIMLNKLDILSGLDEIRLCVAYEIDGRRVDAWPSSAEQLGPGDADLRAIRRLVGAAPRHPGPRRPARGGPALRGRPRGAGRGADRPRLRRTGADPDDRTGLAADAALAARSPAPGGRPASTATLRTALPSGPRRRARCRRRAGRPDDRGGLMAPAVMPTRILIVGGGAREHALAWKLAAEPGVNRVDRRPGQRGDRGARPGRGGSRSGSTTRTGSSGSPAPRPSSWP